MAARRDPNIPLFLWLASAILAHLLWGESADRVADVLEERADVRRFASAVRDQVRPGAELEVALITEEEGTPPSREVPAAPSPSDLSSEVPPPDKARLAEPSAAVPPEPKPPAPEKREEKPPPPPPEEKAQPETPKLLQPPAVDRRIAVEQHVDQDQPDNENAEFIGSKANRVEEQSQASITSTDQNAKDPSPGGQHVSSSEEPGNAPDTDVAQSEDVAGERSRAPSGDASKVERATTSEPAGVPQVAGRARSGPPQAQPGREEKQARATSAAQSAAESKLTGESSDWDAEKARLAREAQRGQAAQSARRAQSAGTPGKALDLLGLGATGLTERGVNLNLTPGSALAAIGQDQLARELKADGERRRSQHRGSWRPVGLDKWRAAIENYVSTVKIGNTTALNTAQRPFAEYLNRIHNRIHPIFAVDYLEYLDELPASQGMADDSMRTDLEIVLSQANGSVVKMGVTRTSGKTAFDIVALESVQRASPFGPPPSEIVSPDGNVYLHWEFHRNRQYACSTYFARPYILKEKPPQAPAPAPFAPEEPAPPARQQGAAPALVPARL